MITTRLIGRLGNQLFQVAAVLSYAKKHNMPFWIPQRSMAEHIWPAFFKHFPKEPNFPYKYFQYKEPEHSYNEIPYHEHICIEGFFQSEKYLKDHRQYILDSFQIPYKQLDGFVSLHVRRSDYLQMQDKHPVITMKYITDAVMSFIDMGYKSFVVCSDDIKWCRENFKPLQQEGAIFSFSAGHTPIEDLAMQSCCVHNIISNSSFSWWAAWLNQNPDKIVIAPKVWFGSGNSHLSIVDLIPEGWIKL